jgi:hypothetical protein
LSPDGLFAPLVLKQLLTCPKAIKAGHSILNDARHLRADWDINIPEAQLCALEHFCHLQGLVPRGNLSLQDLSLSVLHYDVPKPPGMRVGEPGAQRPTNWAGKLSEAQREYAARDAWASLLVYLKTKDACPFLGNARFAGVTTAVSANQAASGLSSNESKNPRPSAETSSENPVSTNQATRASEIGSNQHDNGGGGEQLQFSCTLSTF